MKLAIVGAGAAGGLLAARLALAGTPAPLLARRRTLDTLRRDGLTLETPSGRPLTVHPPVTDDALELGVRDAVLLAVPAHDLANVLEAMAPLVGRGTRLVPVLGGVPWWYPAGLDGRPLRSVDPGGLLWAAMPPGRVVGAVAGFAVERRAEGYIRHVGGLALTLGMAEGKNDGFVEELAALLGAAGFEAAAGDARAAVWPALLAPLAFAPMGFVTGRAPDELARDADARAVATAVVEEVRDLAGRLGHAVADGLDACIALAQRPGRIRPWPADCRPEWEAFLDAPLELADRVGAPVPRLRTVQALVRLCRRGGEALAA